MSIAHHDRYGRPHVVEHEGEEHGHHDGHGHGGAAHGTLAGYLTGFILSVILTAIPFWLVMDMPLPDAQTTGFIVVALAVVQIVVHMVFFLHMDPRSEGGWIMTALVFTLILVVIAISGTLWVMYHLNANMMPAHDMGVL